MSAPRGITLFELLVVTVIFAVVAGAVSLASYSHRTSYLSTETKVYLQQQARQALSEMERELRQAGGTIATAANQITFQMNLGYDQAAPCPANAVCWGARDEAGANQSGWSVRYRLNGTQLVRELVNGAGVLQAGTHVLANDVTVLQFIYVGGTTRTATVQLQVQRFSSLLPGGGLAVAPTPLVSRVKLRNN